MKKNILYLVILLIGCAYVYGNSGIEVKVIEEPVPRFSMSTHAKEIGLIKSIESLANKKINIFAGVRYTTVDDSGNYYLFDFRHGTIIKLDSNFNFIQTIGSKGDGPGEFRVRGMTPNNINVGQDGNLYLSNWLSRQIIKYSLDGKYLGAYKYEQFTGFNAHTDEEGNFYLPSIKGHLIDVHDNKMNYKRSFIPLLELRTYLFFKPPACVKHRLSMPSENTTKMAWLSTGELALANLHNLSITIIAPKTGKTTKRFYAWDDYVLSEYKKKIKDAFDSAKKTGGCGYSSAYTAFFIDKQDNMYLQFFDSSLSIYLHKYTRNGDLVDVFKILRTQLDGSPRFFHITEDNSFIANTDTALLVYKVKK